jgi:hypothetical protein
MTASKSTEIVSVDNDKEKLQHTAGSETQVDGQNTEWG